MEFEPNLGQADDDSLYFGRTGNLLLKLKRGLVEIDVQHGHDASTKLKLDFQGAARSITTDASDPTGGESHYLIGNEPSKWRTHVPHFKTVTYHQLYPAIDLRFYGNEQYIEHDFVVAPGGDPQKILVHVADTGGRISLTDSGDLSVKSGDDNAVVFRKPFVYQNGPNGRDVVEAKFVLRSADTFGFEIGKYDPARILIIDPALASSTYLADMSLYMSAVAADAAGNTYVTGLSFSSAYPVTSTAFRKTCGSCPNYPDVFVTKINAAGTAQVYSTFLGGNNYDEAFGLAVDALGNAVVAGRTESTNFPLKLSVPHGAPGYAQTFAFVTSLSPTGSTLNYSSIFGGSKQTGISSTTLAMAVGLDSAGNAYITGQTNAAAFKVTAMNCCVYPANTVFVAKLLTTGALGYSSLIGDPSPQNGGGGLIGATAIKVDGTGSAYVGGQAGTLWPITANAYQKQIPGDMPYAAPFITKLAPDGKSLVYSTFFGNGQVTGLALDASKNIWITGWSGEPDFPTTLNAYQPAPPPSGCCVPFFSKLSATGSKLLYSSYFYGKGASFGFSASTAIALDANQNIWLSGYTPDPQLPLVHPIQSIFGTSSAFGSVTGFVARFNATGTSLTFSTFFGGQTPATHINGLAIDGLGKIHIAGFTGDDLYTTASAFLPAVTPPPPFYQYTYGFAAVIDPVAARSAVCISYPQNTGVGFWYTTVGTTASQLLNIKNCGTAALKLSAFQVTAPEFAIPDATNHCKTQIAPGGSCSLTVTFSPAAVAEYSGLLKLTSNASIPDAVLPLSGTGAVPQIQTFQPSVAFDPQFINQTSPVQFVFITNAGNAPLTIDLAHTVVTGDFASKPFDCANPMYSGATCVFQLTFTPRVAGDRTGQLSIASNDPATPMLNIALSGKGYSIYPVPAISGLDTSTVPVGPTAATIRVFGNNFFPASLIRINGVAQATTYESGTTLSASISPSFLSTMSELKLTVANPTPGGGVSPAVTVTTYKAIPLAARDLVYEPVTARLYAAVPADAASNPNSIISINPATGALGTPIKVGNDPAKLALSADGQYLFVGLDGDHAIQRVNLKTRLVEKTFSLPVDPFFGQLRAVQLTVVPGSPKSVVATLFRTASPAEDGIALFDDGGLVNWLPNDYDHGYTTVDSFAFAGTPAIIYAVPFTFSSPFFQTFTVDSAGVHATSGNASGNNIALLVSDGKLLYMGDGTVWDPATKAKIGTYNPTPVAAPSIVPDKVHGRTYFLNQYPSNASLAVDSYDQASFQKKSSVAFQGIYSPNAIVLQRWGTNGFAIQVTDFIAANGTNQLILFKSGM